jgi:hypothetical protein
MAGGGGADSRAYAELALPPLAEEIPQQFGGFFSGNSLLHLHLVVELGVVQHPENRSTCAGLEIGGGVNKAIDARMDHGSGTHCAGLKLDVKRAAREAIVAKRRGRCAQSDNFGVGRGVNVAQDAILAAGDNCALVDDDSADGNFAGFASKTSFGQRGLHRF